MEETKLLEGKEEEEPMSESDASLVSELKTVELFIYLHCEACPEQLRKTILKMKGVRTVDAEFSTNKVAVTGTMDADKLVDYIYRRTKKQAKIIPKTKENKVEEEEEEEEEEEPLYINERIQSPLIFSDENPNVCSIL